MSLSSLCRIIMIASSSFLSPSNITIEFAIPAATVPQSLLFCFNDTSFSTTRVKVTSLIAGGDSVDIMSGYAPIQTNNSSQLPQFFDQEANLQLNPLEAPLGLSDVLGTDPFYSTSYSNLRYDDFQTDVFGNNIRGVPSFPNISSFAMNKPMPPPTNCFLLSGNWEPLTHYQMTFTIVNPAHPNSLPALWFASLQASSVKGQKYGSFQASDIAFNLLGSKYGSACPLRSNTSSPVLVQALSSSSSLSESLCLQYSTLYQTWVNRTLSDNIVYVLFLSAFAKQTGGLINENVIQAANATFYQKYMLDNRFPSSPTRQVGGIKPNCNKCTEGSFDSVTNQKVLTDVYDYRYGAMNVFRLIGYIMYSSMGKICSPLWDPAEPLAWTYGPYINILCQAISS